MKVLAVSTHKFLGIMIDQELQWSKHVNYAIHKGMNWVTQYHRLSKPFKPMSAKFMRHFYTLVTIPKILYTADLFLIPETDRSKGMKGSIAKLAMIQRQACLHITGAMKMTHRCNRCLCRHPTFALTH